MLLTIDPALNPERARSLAGIHGLLFEEPVQSLPAAHHHEAYFVLRAAERDLGMERKFLALHDRRHPAMGGEGSGEAVDEEVRVPQDR